MLWRPWLAFSIPFSIVLCLRPFRADDWGLPTRQTGGFDEGREDHPAAPADDRGYAYPGVCEKTQQGHIRSVKHFFAFLGRSPDTATPDDLRAYQLQMTKDLVSATTFNVRIISLRFFFSVTCGREEMKRYMQFQRQPRESPVVLSVEEVAKLLASVPGPGLKYRAALGISYGAGLRPPRSATSRFATATATATATASEC